MADDSKKDQGPQSPEGGNSQGQEKPQAEGQNQGDPQGTKSADGQNPAPKANDGEGTPPAPASNETPATEEAKKEGEAGEDSKGEGSGGQLAQKATPEGEGSVTTPAQPDQNPAPTQTPPTGELETKEEVAENDKPAQETV